MFLPATLILVGQVWSAISEARTGAEVEYTRIQDVSVRNETFFVLDPMLRQVFIYTLAGEHIGTFGRKGDGPGEFSRPPTQLGWKGDTLWVLDYPNRIHYFSPAGRLYRSSAVSMGAMGVTADGGILVRRNLSKPDGPVGDGILQQFTFRHEGGPGPTKLVAELNFFVAVLRVKATINGNQGTTFREEPMRDDPLFAMDRKGEFLWIVHRKTSEEGPYAFRVLKLSTSGDTSFARSYPYKPHRLDQATIDSRLADVQQAILRQSPSYNTVVRRDELSKELYRPAHLPAVEQVLPAADGTVWLRRESLPNGKATYMVLSPQGRQIGSLELPLRERLIEADGQRIWTVKEDEDGVPALRWYRIKRLPRHGGS